MKMLRFTEILIIGDRKDVGGNVVINADDVHMIRERPDLSSGPNSEVTEIERVVAGERDSIFVLKGTYEVQEEVEKAKKDFVQLKKEGYPIAILKKNIVGIEGKYEGATIIVMTDGQKEKIEVSECVSYILNEIGEF